MAIPERKAAEKRSVKEWEKGGEEKGGEEEEREEEEKQEPRTKARACNFNSAAMGPWGACSQFPMLGAGCAAPWPNPQPTCPWPMAAPTSPGPSDSAP